MTPETTTPETPLAWALGAAKQDASVLISPRARARAMAILETSPETAPIRAALLILRDGGAQQGLGDPYRAAPTLDSWRDAADLLGVFAEDFPE